jgi:integrase/recombinase XerD
MQINEEDFRNFITIKEGLDSSSIRHCMSRIGIFNSWLQASENQLTKETVEIFYIYLKDRGLKNNSLNTYHFMFRHLVSYAKDRGLTSDFFDGFKSLKKNKPDIIILTTEEIEKILNTHLTYGMFHGKDSNFLDFRNLTLTMFLAFTGCRFSEAANLTISHLDISAGKAIFVYTKTNENRTAYFTEPLKSNLRELVKNRSPNDRVFRNSSEKQIQSTDFSADLKNRAKVAGITKRVHPHLFRHSYATHLLENGVPITEVASLLGHKDIQTTFANYMHLADKTLELVAMRHPMVRKNVDPKEIIKMIKENIEGYHLENDNRYIYNIVDSGDRLIINILINNPK